MKKRTLIPFWMTTIYRNSNGLERQIAEIKYYYEGREQETLIAETQLFGNELRRKKIEIQFKYGEINEYEKETQLANSIVDKLERELALLDVEKHFQKMSNYDFDIKTVNLTKFGLEKNIALIDCERKHDKISDLEREKQIATLKKEPWVKIITVDVDKENPGIGSVELDWNQPFVDMLVEHGYAAPKPEQTIDLWFDDLCKNIALGAFDGIGDFNENLDMIEDMKQSKKQQTKRRGIKK